MINLFKKMTIDPAAPDEPERPRAKCLLLDGQIGRAKDDVNVDNSDIKQKSGKATPEQA